METGTGSGGTVITGDLAMDGGASGVGVGGCIGEVDTLGEAGRGEYNLVRDRSTEEGEDIRTVEGCVGIFGDTCGGASNACGVYSGGAFSGRIGCCEGCDGVLGGVDGRCIRTWSSNGLLFSWAPDRRPGSVPIPNSFPCISIGNRTGDGSGVASCLGPCGDIGGMSSSSAMSNCSGEGVMASSCRGDKKGVPISTAGTGAVTGVSSCCGT